MSAHFRIRATILDLVTVEDWGACTAGYKDFGRSLVDLEEIIRSVVGVDVHINCLENSDLLCRVKCYQGYS